MKEKSKLARPPRRDPLQVELESDAHVTEATQARGRGAQRRARGSEASNADRDAGRDVRGLTHSWTGRRWWG